MSRFQRTGRAGEAQRATTLELFYDLVFVFAVTQVSHLLLANLSWEGAGQAALILLAVWWSWNYTTWVTNELDPESNVVRLLLIGLMLASLLMAIAIPEAFADKALLFAASYVAIQVGRHAFLTFAAAERRTLERERAGRILTWFAGRRRALARRGLRPRRGAHGALARRRGARLRRPAGALLGARAAAARR